MRTTPRNNSTRPLRRCAASRKLTLTGHKNFTFLKKTGLKKAPFISADFPFFFFFSPRCTRIFPREYFSLDDERSLSLPSTILIVKESFLCSSVSGFNLPGQFAFSKRHEATYLVFKLFRAVILSGTLVMQLCITSVK